MKLIVRQYNEPLKLLISEGGANKLLVDSDPQIIKLIVNNAAVGGTDAYISAGASSMQLGTVVFSNFNGVTFGLNNGTMTASVNTAGGGSVGTISANGGSVALGQVVFSNSNGVSFGLNGSTITGSHNGLTSQLNQAFSASGGSSSFQTLAFANSNGFTFSNSAGSVVGSYTVPAVTNSSATISAGASSGTLSNLVFSNSNGVSFGFSQGTITASVNAGGGSGGVAVSAGANSQNTGTVAFSNSNGITFGLSSDGMLTASHNGLTSQSNQAFSAQGGSSAFQTLDFLNANGLTFSNSNGSVVASYTVPAITNSSLSVSAGNGSSIGSLSQLVFANANNFSFGLSTSNNGSATITGSYTVPSVTNSSWTVSDANTSATVGRLAFTGSNGMTLGLVTSNNGNHTVTGSYTVPTLTNSSLSITAGNGSSIGSLSQLYFSNANNLSFGLSTSNNGSATLTASFSYTQQALTNSSLSITAGNGSSIGSLSQLYFSNANNLSFGLSTSNNGSATLTASFSYTQQALTNSSLTMQAGGSTLSSVSRVAFSDANGISFLASTSNNGSITISASHNALTSQSNQAFSASGGSSAFQTLAFANSNGLTFSNSNGSVVGSYTVPTLTNSSLSITAGNGSSIGSLSQLYFSNANNLSFGLSTSNNGSATLTASFSYTQQALTNSSLTVQAGGSTLSSVSRMAFSDANGISFLASTSNNGSITISASHNAITSQSNQNVSLFALGNTTQNSSTVLNASQLSFNGLGNMTVGFSNGSIQMSGGTAAAGNVNISAGTTSNNLGSVVFSNSNGVSFGLNGSTITASMAGMAAQLTRFENYPVNVIGTVGNGLTGSVNGQMVIAPLTPSGFFPGDMTASTIMMLASLASANTSAQSWTMSIGFYTIANSTALSLLYMASTNVANAASSNNTTGWHGLRYVTFNSSQFSDSASNTTTPVFSKDVMYYVATAGKSSGQTKGFSVVCGFLSPLGIQNSGTLGASIAATNTSMQVYPFAGQYSSGSFPVAISKSSINGLTAFVPVIVFENQISAY